MSATIKSEILPDADAADATDTSDDNNSQESKGSSNDNSLEASDSFDDSSEEYSSDSEPRPRFQGSREKWNRYTRPERELAASLEALDADNLSIHLYNAHALKRKLRPTTNPPQLVKQWERKDGWVSEANKGEWMPSAKWTAWPLEPQRVPRPWESFLRTKQGLDDDSDLIKTPHRDRDKPSREMEECLVAETLRQAREQFYANCSRTSDQQAEAAEPAMKKQKTTSTGDSELFQSNEQQGKDSLSAVPHEGLSIDSAIMVDEEEAQAILQPAIRHVLAKFDDLLTALHRSRLNHLYNDVSGSESEANSTSEDRGLNSADDPTQASSTGPKRKKNGKGLEWSLRTLHPRDWSEIVGTAGILGWDGIVVQRAAARCSELFGESMGLRTLNEYDNQPSKTKGTRNTDASSQHRSISRVRYDPDVGPLVCPVRSCKRHKRNFAMSSTLMSHLKNIHGLRESEEGAFYDDSDPSPGDSSADEMHGGVHVDGFLKPIKMRVEWFSKYKKRTKGPSSEALSGKAKVPAAKDENLHDQDPEDNKASGNIKPEDGELGDETADDGETEDDETGEGETENEEMRDKESESEETGDTASDLSSNDNSSNS